MDQRTYVYDRHGKTIRRSRNLRGIIEHYRANPDDMVVKVVEYPDYGDYDVTFYWPNLGHSAKSRWSDWRVLLDWLKARRSWSIDRVTFDAPLYDAQCDGTPEIAAMRKFGVPVTRHPYART